MHNEETISADKISADTIVASKLAICASDDVPRIILRANEDGDARFIMCDLAGDPRLSISIERSGNVSLVLQRDDKVRFSLSLLDQTRVLVSRADGRDAAWNLDEFVELAENALIEAGQIPCSKPHMDFGPSGGAAK